MMRVLAFNELISKFIFDAGCSKGSGQSRGKANVRRHTVATKSKGCIVNIVWWYEKETMVIILTVHNQSY